MTKFPCGGFFIGDERSGAGKSCDNKECKYCDRNNIFGLLDNKMRPLDTPPDTPPEYYEMDGVIYRS